MRSFEPIAIVGRACLLPGADSPDALLDLVLDGGSALSRASEKRWGVGKDRVAKLIACDIGGYVGALPAWPAVEGEIERIGQLDPLVHWLLFCAKSAIAEAGLSRAPARSALIVGNLSYPSEAMTRFVEAFWLGRMDRRIAEEHETQDPRNRFCSGLPIHLVANALGIGGPAFALDAGCASSLYAIKLACDRLHDEEVDCALAGGIARADDLFIHVGFTALQALSPTGRSRPFHAAADGLVPGEGCAIVALRRLRDALEGGERIFGVIRAAGLSNDGRQNGFLAPASSGQIAAMRAGYEQSALSPSDVGYVECHATGTARGDAIELESLAQVWDAGVKPAIGSLKGNIGHTITASGGASLIKMLGAFERGVLPPSVCEVPAKAVKEFGFDLPTVARAWDDKKARRAAISNFGFGGNNAHLIVEEWRAESFRSRAGSRAVPSEDIALVAVGVVAGEAAGFDTFARLLLSNRAANPRTGEIELAIQGLAFPPNDLKASLAQQTAILAAAEQALGEAPNLPADRTGVFIGMGCDTTVARHGLRLKIAGMLGLPEEAPEVEAWRAANELSAPRLTAAGVLGTMPNIPANRVHAAKDFHGWGLTLASEELSGLAALEIAVRALRADELDAALVGAADFSCEPAHEAAQAAALPRAPRSADAALVLVLMRASEAKAQRRKILATIDRASLGAASEAAAASRFGHAHAASGLLEVLAAVVQIAGRMRITDRGARPALASRDQSITIKSFSGRASAVYVSASAAPFAVPSPVPHVAVYAAADRGALSDAIGRREQLSHSPDHPVRLALVADSAEGLEQVASAARAMLARGEEPRGPGISYSEKAITGEIAFCFTGAAAVYPGAAKEFFAAFPEVGDSVAERFAGTAALGEKLFASEGAFDPMTQLTACALVCQVHAEFTRQILRIEPDAAIGLSSGETNALLAFGVWRDLDAMLGEIDASGLYARELAGDFLAARRHWRLRAEESVDWRCWRLAAPPEQVRAALENDERCHLTIVHAPDDCVIGGDAAACERVIARIGKARALPLGLDMIVHSPALAPFAKDWHRIHSRNTHGASGVRFYTNAGNRPYIPSRDSAADAITQQALETIDFPKTVERAYADGVRIFVEHGPRGILTTAIGKILRGKPHLAVALDRREGFGLKGLVTSVLQLWAAGVELDLAPLLARLRDLAPKARDERRMLKLPAHPPDIVWPRAAPANVVRMVPPHEAVAYDLSQAFGLPAVQPAVASAPLPKAVVARAAGATNDAAVRLFADVAHIHRSYIAQQKSLHDRFLRVRALGSVGHRLEGPSPHASEPDAPPLAPVALAEKPAARVKAPGTRGLSKEDLLVHASGRISEIFGPQFAQQDGFARQVRMPEPPLLLADRAVSLEGEPGSMGKGRIVTETDVGEGAWYLHRGRMSPGTVIEAGQADLLLISWLGADFLNKGERVYRLLGCDLTLYGGLPQPGDTLRYDIRIDGHAKTGDVRLFFFHYDCHIGDRLLLSVREGQAGFFSDEELASSGGVLWDAEGDAPKPDARLDAPPRLTHKRAFTKEEIEAWRAGDAFACFGEGFERSASHQRTPAIPSGRLALIDDVPEFDPQGGPWKRGYLRARAHVPADAWFYRGHFKNDPCMPGTLMADAATQALATAMAAMGFTIGRDGWRFEPVPDAAAKFVCRGQVVPDRPHTLDYEVFIEEVVDGPEPRVFAALLCKSDGFKVFGCRRFGLRLVPDWPLSTRGELLRGLPEPRFVGGGDVRGDEAALLACAWGRPSDAFGRLYEKFDGSARAPRLPGPPYHVLTRVVAVDGTAGAPKLGASVITEYDVPAGAWYFAEGAGRLPLSVLTEVLLQPCGWLASYLGFAASRESDVLFRNLDGDAAVIHRFPDQASGKLTVKASLDRFAQAAGSTIVFFTVTCEDSHGLVMSLKTDFGFFEPAALRAQVGLPVTDKMRSQVTEASGCECDSRRAFAPLSRLEKLRMLDEVTGYWPPDGEAAPARIRARQRVDPRAWYFKAHFYQDPVQPGSLGLEAMFELASVLLALRRPDLRAPFEVAPEPFSWRFRGQVTPEAKEVVTEIEELALAEDAAGASLRARGHLWVDGLRIYEMPSFTIRTRP